MEHKPQNQDALMQQIDVEKLKFKVNTTVSFTKKILSNAYCDVCFKIHEQKTGRLRKYEEPGQDILLCYGCDAKVHHYCYGLKTPFNDVPNDSQYRLRMFVCDKCLYLGPDVIQECAICFQQGKALKKTNNDKYVHIMCALFSEECRVIDFETMEIESYNSKTLSERKCDFCDQPNVDIHCNYDDCKRVCHAYCAWMNKIDFLHEDDESALGWRMAFLPEANTNTLSLDTLQLKVNEKIEGHEENKNINESMQEKTLKDTEKEVEEALSYFSQYIELTEIEKDVLLSECPGHRSPELFCVCKTPFDPSRLMVACDTCEGWFHPECMGIDLNNLKYMKNYFCKGCQHWAKIRLQCFQPETQVEQETPLETKDPNQIIPRDTSSFWVMDYIVTCIIFQRKAFKALLSPVEFKQSLKEILSSLKFIPFKLDAMVVNVLSQYYSSMAIDKTLKS